MFFKRDGAGYQRRMNAVPRAFVLYRQKKRRAEERGAESSNRVPPVSRDHSVARRDGDERRLRAPNGVRPRSAPGKNRSFFVKEPRPSRVRTA
jgi:hypothetical protein